MYVTMQLQLALVVFFIVLEGVSEGHWMSLAVLSGTLPRCGKPRHLHLNVWLPWIHTCVSRPMCKSDCQTLCFYMNASHSALGQSLCAGAGLWCTSYRRKQNWSSRGQLPHHRKQPLGGRRQWRTPAGCHAIDTTDDYY